MSWMTLLALWLGCLLDYRLGEPRRWHPLVGFGHFASWLEKGLNRAGRAARGLGVLAWILAVLPLVVLAFWLRMRLVPLGAPGIWLYTALGALGLYWALGGRSLVDHLRVIRLAFAQGEIDAARVAVGRVVSRDCTDASWSDLRRAALESALENTSDAIVAPLFWFAALGLPGVILYRLSNTLDAMWGYRNARLLHFGWAAARVDDGLNWLPARLTAMAFVVTAPGFRAARLAARAWFVQARRCESPNAGPVMCAGAGALGVALGGPAWYHGQIKHKPWFGGTHEPEAHDLPRAMALIHRSVALVLLLLSTALLGVALWPWTS